MNFPRASNVQTQDAWTELKVICKKDGPNDDWPCKPVPMRPTFNWPKSSDPFSLLNKN